MARPNAPLRQPGIFVDTATWLALINRDDSLYSRAWVGFREALAARRSLYTTQFVIIEVADALASTRWRLAAIDFLDDLADDAAITIVPVDTEILSRSWQLYKTRPDKDWGLTDCTSFTVMKNHDFAEALTPDRHFEQAGFRRLL